MEERFDPLESPENRGNRVAALAELRRRGKREGRSEPEIAAAVHSLEEAFALMNALSEIREAARRS